MMIFDQPLTDDDRFPLIPADQRELLDRLRQHEFGPRYNMRCGDRLGAEGFQRVTEFEKELFAHTPNWDPGQPPEWVKEFARRCLQHVPIYRRGGGFPDAFTQIPTVSRDDIKHEPWSFVPDDQPLDDLMNYYTSGTSGRRIDVLSHPVTASKRLPILRKALARHGVTLDGGKDRVAILFICSQSTTFTYASLSAYLGGAAHVKINLNPSEWRAPGDRVPFIDECNPEILTGDPLSLLDLAALPVSIRPKAMISSAMMLLPRMQRKLEERFGCPVIDMYSTCESGPIGVRTPAGFEMASHDIYIEILRHDGSVAAPGERGEITFTGGRNPFLPLLRYRTGDWGALSYDSGVPAIVDFEGRAPVVFRATDGRLINNIDITIVMRNFPVSRFSVHQGADGALTVRTSGEPFSEGALATALRQMFGGDQRVSFETLPTGGEKVIPYTTDLNLPL